MNHLTVFYLSSCSTCKRIINELKLPENTILQCIKNEPLTIDDLNKMHLICKSYKELFSKRAIKYRSMGLHEKKLSEENLKNLILQEYTFLKRPVFLFQKDIFIGNSKKTIQELKEKYNF